MLKKIFGFFMTAVLMLGVLGLFGCYYNNNVAKPFIQEEILLYLSEKYDEEFVFNKKEYDSDIRKFSKFVYSYSPKDNQSLSFYVVDQTIQSDRIKVWDRILNDTYPLSLLQSDFHNIMSICGRLTIETESFEDLLSYAKFDYGKNFPYLICLNFNEDYEFNEIDLIAQQLYDVANYFKENSVLYKNDKTELQVSILSAKITIYSNDTVSSLELITETLQNVIA